jgi:hypothetical protein
LTRRRKKTRKKRSGGVLTDLAKSGPSKKKKKGKPSTPRKVLNWTVGIAIGAAVLGIVVLYAMLSFNPTLQERPGEAEVTVEAIDPDPAGYSDDTVALARVTVDGRPVVVPLTAERRDALEVGTRLHLRYVFFPQTGTTRIDEWSVVP